MAGNRQRHIADEESMVLRDGPPLLHEHKRLIELLARETVEDFLREIEQTDEVSQ